MTFNDFNNPVIQNSGASPNLATFNAMASPFDIQRAMGNIGSGALGVLPQLSAAEANANIAAAMPYAQSQLNVAQQTSPQYNALMTQLYGQYAPMLNQIGNQITGQNMMAGQQNINNMMAGPGAQTVGMANQMQQFLDPQFYQQRQVEQQGLQKLIQSIDPSAALSPTEMNEISQGLARQNAQAGTLFNPSQTNTLANAMQYGQAGFNRMQQNRSALSQALNSSTAFLPTSKSGMNAASLATGGMGINNPGAQYFTGINQQATPGVANGLAGSLFGQGSGTYGNYMNNFTSQMNNNQNAAVSNSQAQNALRGQMASQMGSSLTSGLGMTSMI
jgi:hypothetical protein